VTIALAMLFVVVLAALLYLGVQGYLADRARRARTEAQRRLDELERSD
jgi:hypothetical protein